MQQPPGGSKPNILLIAPAPIEPGHENTLVAGEMGKSDVSKNPVHSPLYLSTRRSVLGCHFLDAGSIEGIHMYPYDYMHLSQRRAALNSGEKKSSELIPDLF